ncbi:hypothetical protein A2U01_0058376, partial [Trifolium medium]|nr:hypothetical protein [Trifolium medium]
MLDYKRCDLLTKCLKVLGGDVIPLGLSKYQSRDSTWWRSGRGS